MNVSFVYCIPFACMLLCVAIGPIAFPEFWEKYQAAFVALWSLLFVIPYGMAYGVEAAAEGTLECIFGDYITFIVLLFGLYCVAGNITLDGDLAGSPRVNIALLLIGGLMSSWIGTTGASMLMVRPILKANSWRRRKKQVMIFFIFIISNIGGALTPIGDPPLLMGFARGVPFFWSLRVTPIMLFNFFLLLFLFYWLDRDAYRRDIRDGLKPDISKPGTHLSIRGKHNVLFIIAIVAAVVLSGVLPSLPAFRSPEGHVLGIHIFGEVTFTWPQIIECVIILAAAWLSFKTTPKSIRRANHFTWGAITEVAILFIGIFITMQPALLILKANGAALGVDTAGKLFWATGALSSFLDNTPTYLVFLTTAGTLGAMEGIATGVGTIAPRMLLAISCGAVFMGANTYIGNAPNFMVKAIAQENGVRMPSFFGYILWSLGLLVPVFVLDWLLFFS